MRRGILLAASAYVAWGLFPAYFHALMAVSPVEVLAHRMIWSLVFLFFVLAFRRQWSWLAPVLRQPRVMARFALSAALLSGNWLLYIWAVTRGHVIDASLGYFINPLVNILLGFVLLKERLRAAQWFAIGIAAMGVLWLTWQGHHFPWISIVLALTFGFYGLMRKVAVLGPLEGLSLETLLLFPLAAAYLGWTSSMGTNVFMKADLSLRLLLMAAGPITAIPLLTFAAGARLIKLSTLGLLQFIAPTLQLLLGIWMFHEPFDGARAWGFVIIWTALALYCAEGLLRIRRTAQPPQTLAA